ncbi:hypothetical protein DIPPA_10929 [Diplonema papillatum]|nr:hypothetical protein DIPPA_10929 [Diplonema papillatum]
MAACCVRSLTSIPRIKPADLKAPNADLDGAESAFFKAVLVGLDAAVRRSALDPSPERPIPQHAFVKTGKAKAREAAGSDEADRTVSAVGFYNGIGGNHFALNAACALLGLRVRVLQSVEINDVANATYRANFPGTQTSTGAPWQWVPASGNKKTAPAELRAEDWSTPILDVNELIEGEEEGVAIADVRRAIAAIAGEGKKKKKGSRAIVVLGAAPGLDRKTAEETTVVVTRGRQIEAVAAWVVQLGDGNVRQRRVLRSVPMPVCEERKVSVRIPKSQTTNAQWEEAARDLRGYLRKHAAETGAGSISITGVETRGRFDDPTRFFGALVRTTEEGAAALAKASGRNGVFAVPKGDEGPVVWLSTGTKLEEAQAFARDRPGLVIRLAVNKRGLGLRVKTEDEERARKEAAGAAVPKQQGRLYDVSGFDRGTTAGQAELFLRTAGWADVKIIRAIPKRGGILAVVRGQDPPTWEFGVEGAKARILVSTTRYRTDTNQRWVQAIAQERRKDPGERGTAREDESYTWKEFVQHYGTKQAEKEWSNAGREKEAASGVVPTEQQPAAAGVQNGKGTKGSKVEENTASAVRGTYAQAATASGKKGSAEGKSGKQQQPQVDEVGQQLKQLQDENRRLNEKLEGAAKAAEEERKATQEVIAQNHKLSRRVEELSTLLMSLQEQVQATNRRAEEREKREASPPHAAASLVGGKRRRAMCARITRVPGDGNCQFSAIAEGYGGVDAGDLRQRVVANIEANTARYWNAMVGEELAPYTARMRLNGTYGDEVTLCAAAEVLQCSIWVINAERRDAIQRWSTEGAERTVVVTYLPQHYDSVHLPYTSIQKLEQAVENALPLTDLFIGRGRARQTESGDEDIKAPVRAALPARTQKRRVDEAKAGELSRPQSDDMVIVTINITSLDTEKLLVVALLKADIVVLQETRVTRVEKAFLSSYLAAYGWNVHWGDDVTMVEGKDGRRQRRPGGVAVMTRQHLKAQRVAPKDESEKRVVESTRVVHVAIALGDGKTALHVFSVYGHSGNGVQVQREREVLLTEVLGIAAGLGQVPTLIIGDFNCTAETRRGGQVVSNTLLATKYQGQSTRGASTKQTRARDELLGHLRTLVHAGQDRLSAGVPYPLTRREEKAREAARRRVKRGHIPETVANVVKSNDLSELEVLQNALTELEGSQKATFTALRQHRRAQWSHKMQEAWAHGRGLVFDYIADRYSSPLMFLQRDDRSLTANAVEIDEILRSEGAWGGIFNRHDADPAQQPIPLDYKEACRFVGDLQRFYLAVLRARQIKDDREQETSRHHRLSLYPWGWKTPSPRRVSMPVIEAEAIAQQWKHGSQLWKAVHWWIRRLRWAHIGSEHTVTFVELAVDFELTTGVLLPEATNRRIQPPTASGAKPTTARAVLAQHEVVAGLCMYFDGGSRQNGTALAVAGAGAVVYKDGEKIAEARVPLGRATNNVAEYNGLIAGIRLLSEQPPDVEGHVTVRGDSKVVIGTVQGTAMCKPNLRPYYLQATANMADLSPRFDFELEHVPRASNVDADALSNAAMDMVHAETNAQEGTIRAQYNDYRSSALAKSLSLRAITGAATRICGMTWHYGHVTNVTSLTALGGGVMQGISCRAELAPQTETVLRKMAQQVPSTSHRSNPFVKAHEAWAASMHPEQLYDATWKETAEWKGREQERGASGQRSRRPPTARRPSNAAIKCEKHDARRCATCKKRRLPPDTCCNQQHTGHEAGSLNQSRLQFRTARDHREQPAGPSFSRNVE